MQWPPVCKIDQISGYGTVRNGSQGKVAIDLQFKAERQSATGTQGAMGLVFAKLFGLNHQVQTTRGGVRAGNRTSFAAVIVVSEALSGSSYISILFDDGLRMVISGGTK